MSEKAESGSKGSGSQGSKQVTWEIPVKIDCDVLVIGGGTAGISAAIASSRHGAKTTLIEQYNCVGGMATVGLVGPFMTSFDTEGKEQIVKGIFEEMVQKMIKEGGAIHPSEVPAGVDHASFIVEAHHNVTPFDPEIMKYVAMEMLLEAGVEVKLHTRLVRALMTDGVIEHVVFSDKSGLGLAKASTFVDATGDADLAAFSGAPFEKGREEDGKLQPATMFLRIGNVNDGKVRAWATEMKNEGRLFQSSVAKAREEGNFPENLPRDSVGMYRQPREGEWRINTSRILGIDGTDPDSLTRAEIEGRRQAIGLMKFFNTYCYGLEDAYLIDTANQVGIRETRRIEGLYTLTKDDVQEARQFEDAIARYSFFLDIHNPEGSGQETAQRLFITGGRYFEIPYRCLVPIKVDNLLVCGRSISADHHANGATRIMPACFATGQAAGTAAAQTVEDGCKPAGVDVEKLQAALRKDGCVL